MHKKHAKDDSKNHNHQNNFVIKSNTTIKLVEVYDFLGTKVKSFEYNQSLMNSIDISALPTGRYFVKIFSESGKQEIIQLIKK